MKNTRIFLAAVFYGTSVFLAEATLGNPEFPFNLWAFETIDAYKWSIPVHFAGFLWLVFWNRRLYQKPVIFPAAIAALFFLFGETANRFGFDFFRYEGNWTGSAEFSFWAIIGLYFILCVASSVILRSEDL